MSACSFNGESPAHNYEASAVDIVAQQELEREHHRDCAHEHTVAAVTQFPLSSSSPQQQQVPSPSSSPPTLLTATNGDNNNEQGSIGPLTTLNSNIDTNTAVNAANHAENPNSIISLMQSSPPPHSYRHSRAYRHFKNPPQPHMCIRTTTEAGEELFINVLSWTRIVIPQEPSDPIPLYGGMRVPPGSARSPPIVFAVMANPEVLKDSGRHSKDPEERRAIVELMCDFVEAMNPGVKLVRNAVILKDRDISGELKDVWNAVQAQRDREREEQMLQQRQQQHYHNITTQQMFPKIGGQQQQPQSPQQQQQEYQPQQHEQIMENVEQSAAVLLTVEQHELPPTAYPIMMHESQALRGAISNNVDIAAKIYDKNNMEMLESSAAAALAGEEQRNLSVTVTATSMGSSSEQNNALENFNNSNCALNELNSSDQTDAAANEPLAAVVETNNLQNKAASTTPPLTTAISNNTNMRTTNSNVTTITTAATTTTYPSANHQNNNSNKKLAAATPATSPTETTISTTTTMNTNTTTLLNKVTTPAAATTAPPATITSPPPKKDKLVGFLPNGCIFPRFKHSRNRDKDKEKESKSKDKEKTFMHALKKNKDKKSAAAAAAVVVSSEHAAVEKTAAAVATAANAPITTTTLATSTDAGAVVIGAETKSNQNHQQQQQHHHHQQSLISLENEVQKLDLGNGGSSNNGDSTTMFIKLKVPSSTAIAK